jgi:hypothetical protein
MATPDILKAPPGQEAGPHAAGADVLPFTPHQADGDFHNPVVDREKVVSGTFREGTTELEIFTMQNGRHYEVLRGIPARQRSEIDVDMSTALATSIHGHNFHTALKVMELGFPVTLIGPEGGHQRLPRTLADIKRFLDNLSSISILETALNAHEIIDVIDADPNPISQRGKAIRFDESRAAAVAIGFNALNSVFKRDAIYSDLTAAPFPDAKPVELKPSSIGRASQIATQVGSLVWNNGPMGLRRGRHFVRTANPNPYFILHAAATIPTLVSGLTGELARQMPTDAKVHHTHFTEDPWTDIPGWAESSEGHPFVVHDLQSGDHGAIARRDTQINRLMRLEKLRDELELTGQRPQNIDWEHVYLEGQLAVAA